MKNCEKSALKSLTILTVLTLFLSFNMVGRAFAKPSFDAWLEEVKNEARRLGVSERTITLALPESLKFLPRVIELDQKQPEKTKSFEQYKKGIVSKARVKKGREMLLKYAPELKKISADYGVQPRFIVALWGIETYYGKYTGGFKVVPSLATLAYEGRRHDFFRTELLGALQIIDEGHIQANQMKGSWAGAMGQSQFMPSSFIKYAVDYNHDGRRDIWNTKIDVFASAANYLAQNGWRGDETWGRRVFLPKNLLDTKYVGLKQSKLLKDWQKLGVRKFDGTDLPEVKGMKASLVQPDGSNGASYLVYNNYKTIMSWNRSTYFATSVGLLADRLGGR